MTLSEILGVAKNAIRQSLFKVEGKVEVDFPDIQKVEITNPPSPTEIVEVSNLPALEESFSKAVFELGDNLIHSLEELQKSIPEDKTSKITEKIEKLGKSLGKDLDLSKVIKGLSDVKKSIDGIEIPKTELDLKPILAQIKQLGELIPDLSDYTKYGEFKVLLNPGQLDKLVKALNVSLAVSSGGSSGGGTVDTSLLATSAKQDTIIGHVDGIEGLLGTIDADTGNIATSVASIDTKTPALGQALAAASVPVILPSATITTLTPPAAITGFSTETTLASIKDTAGIKKITDALPAGTNLLGKVQETGLSGTGDDTTITLTSSATAYQVPASPPASDYILILSNQSDTNILWGFENSGTLGNLLVASTGLASMRMAANDKIYGRCASAGKVLNYSTKIV